MGGPGRRRKRFGEGRGCGISLVVFLVACRFGGLGKDGGSSSSGGLCGLFVDWTVAVPCLMHCVVRIISGIILYIGACER